MWIFFYNFIQMDDRYNDQFDETAVEMRVSFNYFNFRGKGRITNDVKVKRGFPEVDILYMWKYLQTS